MKKEIRWEYWANPLGGGREYMDDDGHEDEDDETPFGDEEKVEQVPVRPVIPTAGGLVPIHVYGNFAANFNFWMMHTNFNISDKVIDILKRVPGVETCDVVSRYRARLSFGKCFDSADVKRAVQEALSVGTKEDEPPASQMRLDEDTLQRVQLLKAQAKERYKHWAIYVIPNGEIAFIHSDTDEEYRRRLELFRQAQSLAGGLLFTSHES